MTLEEFVIKYSGKKVDYDGVFGSQCVDLFRQYCIDVLLIAEHTGSCQTSGGAKDLFLDYNKMPVEKKYFARGATKRFMQGDVLIWNESLMNKYGHVAIYMGGNKIVHASNAKTGIKISYNAAYRKIASIRRVI